MSKRRADRAIILAAGRGSRLAQGDTLPKPLRPVAGTPLLVRILRTLAKEGVREAVIIVGYEGHRIREALVDVGPALGVELHFVENPLWERSNGVSLLAAAEWIDRDCLLTMSDHLVAPELVRALARAEVPSGACALGVDFDIERCFDLDDATKVRVRGHAIEAISKDLPEFNAIDTGIFRVNAHLVRELRALFEAKGDASLSDGVRALAARGRFAAVDVGDARWIDVDTPAAHARAEAMLRVFGDDLDDDLESTEPRSAGPIDPEAMELHAPSWVRGAPVYRDDHFGVADRAARHRDGFARLMSNESPFAPSARVQAAVMAALARGHRYPDAAMARELRRRLAGEHGLGEESCVLGAGSSEVIDLVVRTFVAPGEEVVISVPTFSMYESRTRVTGGVPVLVPMRDDLTLDVSAVLEAVTERTKVIFLCSPNNPTGRRVSAGALHRLLRLGIPVVLDEAYVEFGDADSDAPLVATHPNLLVVRTFSKAMGLAGLRVGYALCAEPVARLLHRVKLPWNVSTLALAAALAVLDDAAELARQRDAVREERAMLVRELGRMPGVSAFASEGNFVLLDIHETGMTADAIVQAMLHDGVFIRSLASHHLRRGYVRVSVGSPDENRRCVDAMRRTLDRRAPRPAAH
ncbi:MAG: histidinol-phosphate transaminase [Polyangiales bacterium]